MSQYQSAISGNLRIIAMTTGYWNNEAEARGRLQNGRDDSRNDHGLIGIQAWKDRMQLLFSPIAFFMASGSWSDPAYSWVKGLEIVNAGAFPPQPHDGHFHHLGKAAWTAGIAFALNRMMDWDLISVLDTDSLVGDINLNSIVREFWDRPEILCCPGWGGVPGGPMILIKREGACRILHNREGGNFRDKLDQKSTFLWEAELMHIFRPLPDGTPRWWNPFPNYFSLIYDPIPESLDWPMVSQFGGDTEFAKRYSEKNCPLTIPYRRDPVTCCVPRNPSQCARGGEAFEHD